MTLSSPPRVENSIRSTWRQTTSPPNTLWFTTKPPVGGPAIR